MVIRKCRDTFANSYRLRIGGQLIEQRVSIST